MDVLLLDEMKLAIDDAGFLDEAGEVVTVEEMLEDNDPVNDDEGGEMLNFGPRGPRGSGMRGKRGGGTNAETGNIDASIRAAIGRDCMINISN